MPKATTGGATNAWEPQVCRQCGAQVAAGAPRCPECPSTSFEAAAQEHPGYGGPMEGVEHPADGTMPALVGDDPVPGEPEPVQVAELAEPEPPVPDAVPEPAPAAPPRTPPRRA